MKEKGWTQSEVGVLIGRSQGQVSKILSGRTFPEPEVALRIAALVGLSPDEAGIATSKSPFLTPDAILQIGATVRLAERLRNLGDARGALPELFPAIRRLKLALAAGQSDDAFAALLIDALLTLTVILGDLSREEDTAAPIQAARQAVSLSDEFADVGTQAHARNTLANQLRVAGQLSGARSIIHEAARLKSGLLERGATASWLARIESEAGNRSGYDRAIAGAWNALDKLTQHTSLVNPVSVGEIEVRGLLALGDVARASTRLEELEAGSVASAPQWNAILAITRAEVLLALGDIEAGVAAMAEAAEGAADLPHQLQRIERALRRSTASEARDLRAQVHRML